jgi:hypothetical protein
MSGEDGGGQDMENDDDILGIPGDTADAPPETKPKIGGHSSSKRKSSFS